jgi:hypothetical protein
MDEMLGPLLSDVLVEPISPCNSPRSTAPTPA